VRIPATRSRALGRCCTGFAADAVCSKTQLRGRVDLRILKEMTPLLLEPTDKAKAGGVSTLWVVRTEVAEIGERTFSTMVRESRFEVGGILAY
jgi:hypothetical protein